MNIEAANKIERQNEDKNSLIRSTYFFNPVSFVQRYMEFLYFNRL